jgi:two-component system sensor histidine kinase KdpD
MDATRALRQLSGKPADAPAAGNAGDAFMFQSQYADRSPEQIASISNRFVQSSFGAKAALLLMSEQDKLLPPMAEADALEPSVVDMGIAQWVFQRGEPAGFGTDTLPGSSVLYLPLRAPMRTRGVLAVQPTNPRWLLVPEQRRQIDVFAALAAVALERVHYVDIAQKALLRMESERLLHPVPDDDRHTLAQ